MLLKVAVLAGRMGCAVLPAAASGYQAHQAADLLLLLDVQMQRQDQLWLYVQYALGMGHRDFGQPKRLAVDYCAH